MKSVIRNDGFWRPIIGRSVEKFLDCGDLQEGFARVRCPKCRHEFFVAYSCRGRCFCPSCYRKRALQTALWLSQEICAAVPHRQFVFTIPKRLRIYFRFERRLLGELCRSAWQVVRQVYAAAASQPKSVPGTIAAIQTFGDLIHAHPHIHALVSEGFFLPEGRYVPMPKLATEPFLKLWEQEVFNLHSNKKRGLRAKGHGQSASAGSDKEPIMGSSAKQARKRWAALIKQVYEIDPLRCSQCGAEMRIISFIERHLSEVIEEILRHCGLWEEARARDPPPAPEPVVGKSGLKEVKVGACLREARAGRCLRRIEEQAFTLVQIHTSLVISFMRTLCTVQIHSIHEPKPRSCPGRLADGLARAKKAQGRNAHSITKGGSS